MKFLCANRIVPDGTPCSAASHLGLYCLPMPHKRDARLNSIRVNIKLKISAIFFSVIKSAAASENQQFAYAKTKVQTNFAI